MALDVNSWPTRTLKSCATWYSGGTPSKAIPKYWGGTIPWISAKSLTRFFISDSEDRVTEEGSTNGTRLVPENTILFIVRGMSLKSEFRMGITTRPVTFNQDVKALIAVEDIVPSYLAYAIQSKTAEILNLVGEAGHGTGVLPTDRIQNLEIPVPSISEQQAIARILKSIDDQIELNRQTNATLQAIAAALYNSWFKDFHGVEQENMQESELGLIPKGWSVMSVNDIGDIVCGKTPSTQVSEYYGDDVPFITIPEMHGKIFTLHIQKRLSHVGAKSQEKKMLPAGAICVSCIATLGLVTITTEPSQTNQQINSVILSAKDETYFWYWTLKNLGAGIKAAASGGSVLGNLNTSSFSALRVIAATKELRTTYHAYTESLFLKILENERRTATLIALRDTLLPRLISGKLRIPDAAQQIAEVAT
ncbi:MAG: restriction endonuclease subunit S [Cyanobacteria bacterium TGS_CYA1]|nr:restriction endonuclease subunit S [Cyanobacteria bacterium TGS_CYA1]